MTDLTEYTREDIRGLAILKVDAAHGYTVEQSSSPERHREEYDEKERELLKGAAEQWREKERVAKREAARTAVVHAAAIHAQQQAEQRVRAIERWIREFEVELHG